LAEGRWWDVPLERLPVSLAVLRRLTLHAAQNRVDVMPDNDVTILARRFLEVRRNYAHFLNY
jgi:hypothetical protein